MVSQPSKEPSVYDSSESSGKPQPGLPDIPFNRPSVEGRELEYVEQAIRGGHPSSGGEFSERVASLLVGSTGSSDALMTTSCTSALELSALLLDLQPGDTVVVPSFSFTTTALAFARQGAGLLFCDVERDTLGLDPRHLATLLDESVRAVVVVHYAGISCDLDGLRTVLADWPDVDLIEDNAHALFGTWGDQPLGSFGRFAAQSFHETKNFTCGEGGALLVNDERDVDRARVLYDKGTNRRAFMLGQVEKYTWLDTGSSFGLADVLSAYLLGQLEERESIQSRRQALHQHYTRELAPLAEELEFEVMHVPEGRGSAYHMFYVLLADRSRRNDVLEAMGKDGVSATFHYLPLHASVAGRQFAVRSSECPVTDDVSGRLLRLPFFNDLTEHDADRVVSSFTAAARAAIHA